MFALTIPSWAQEFLDLFREWRGDAHNFLHRDLPKIALVILGAILLIRLMRVVTARIGSLRVLDPESDHRARQLHTLAGVINSVGMFAIVFVAALQVLSQLGFNLGPLLASAGIAGLAIGFGAQTLVKDVINGFFILLENQYDVGDTVRTAGVKGVVEEMTLRRTVLRDDDGTVHVIPNSEVKLVSNMTRDWSTVSLRTTVAYTADSDRVINLLREAAESVWKDPEYAANFISGPQVLGIERLANGEADYLLVARTKPGGQYAVARELRRRIKSTFEANKIQVGVPARVYVSDPPSA